MTLLYPPSLDSIAPAFLAQDQKVKIPFSKPTYANWPEGMLAVNVRAVQQSNNKSVLKNLDKHIRKVEQKTKTFQVDNGYYAAVTYDNKLLKIPAWIKTDHKDNNIGDAIKIKIQTQEYLTHEDIIDHIVLVKQYELTSLYLRLIQSNCDFIKNDAYISFDLPFNEYKTNDEIKEIFKHLGQISTLYADKTVLLNNLQQQQRWFKELLTYSHNFLHHVFYSHVPTNKWKEVYAGNNVIYFEPQWLIDNFLTTETNIINIKNRYSQMEKEVNLIKQYSAKLIELIPHNSGKKVIQDLNDLLTFVTQQSNAGEGVLTQDLKELSDYFTIDFDFRTSYKTITSVCEQKIVEINSGDIDLVGRQNWASTLQKTESALLENWAITKSEYEKFLNLISAANVNVELLQEELKYYNFVKTIIFPKDNLQYLKTFDLQQYTCGWLDYQEIESTWPLVQAYLNQTSLTDAEKIQIILFLVGVLGISIPSILGGEGDNGQSDYDTLYAQAVVQVLVNHSFTASHMLDIVLKNVEAIGNKELYLQFYQWFSDLKVAQDGTTLDKVVKPPSGTNWRDSFNSFKNIFLENKYVKYTEAVQEKIVAKLKWIFNHQNTSHIDLATKVALLKGDEILESRIKAISLEVAEYMQLNLVKHIPDEWFFNRKELIITVINYCINRDGDDIPQETFQMILNKYLAIITPYDQSLEEKFTELLQQKYETVLASIKPTVENAAHYFSVLLSVYQGEHKDASENFKTWIDNIFKDLPNPYYGFDFTDKSAITVMRETTDAELLKAANQCMLEFFGNPNIDILTKLFLYCKISDANYDEMLATWHNEVSNSKEYLDFKANMELDTNNHLYFAYLSSGWLNAEVVKIIYSGYWLQKYAEYQEKAYNILSKNSNLFVLANPDHPNSLDYDRLPQNADIITSEQFDDIILKGKVEQYGDKLPREVQNFVKEQSENILEYSLNKQNLYMCFQDFSPINTIFTLFKQGGSSQVSLDKYNANKSKMPISLFTTTAEDSQIITCDFRYNSYTQGWVNDDTYYTNMQWSSADDKIILSISQANAEMALPTDKDTYLKIQMRIGYAPEHLEIGSKYAEHYTEWSEWSTIMVTKTLANVPELTLKGTFDQDSAFVYEPSATPLFAGTFSYDGQEYLDKYRFVLLDEKNKMIEDSGWLQANKNLMEYRFKRQLTNKQNYTTKLEVITNNLYQMSTTLDYQVYISNLLMEDWGSSDHNVLMRVYDGNDSAYCAEEGCIQICLATRKAITGNIIVSRSSEKDNFTFYEPIYQFQVLEKTFYGEPLFTDFTIESGVKYKYIIQKENGNTGLRTKPLYDYVKGSEGEFFTHFEYCYLYDGDVQLKLKYDEKMSSYKQTVLMQKQDTLGGKYPIVLRNGMASYAEFPITGLITLHMDENGNFFKETEDGYYYKNELVLPKERYMEPEITINYEVNQDRIESKVSTNYSSEIKTSKFNTNLTNDNIYVERKFREKVIEFLTATDVFLFKSPDVGNKIISLTNVAFQPKENLERMIYAFTSTAYEIMENTISNLIDYGIWKVTPFQEEINLIDNVRFGQWQGVLHSGENIRKIVEDCISSIEVEDVDGELVRKIAKIDHFWIEPYPKLDIDLLEYYNNAEISVLTMKLFDIQNPPEGTPVDEEQVDKLMAALKECEHKALELIELKDVLEQANAQTSFAFKREDGSDLYILPGRIYAADEDILSLSLIHDIPQAFMFHFIYQMKYVENEAIGLYGYTSKKAWGQLHGVFTTANKEIFMFKIQSGDHVELNVFDDLNISDEIQRQILDNLILQPGSSNYYSYTDFKQDYDNHNIWTITLPTGEIKKIIFHELLRLEIEAAKNTKINFLVELPDETVQKQTFLIGPTERIAFDSLSLWEEGLFEIAFDKPTQALVNYEYDIQILTYGKGGAQVDEADL